MKINLKLLLAGIVLPVGFTSFLGSATLDKNDVAIEKIQPYVIEIHPADGSVVQTISGTSKSTDPFTIAKELGANPDVKDKFKAFPDIRMGIGSQITIYRAPKYTIIDGRKATTYRSWSSTVSELLDEQNIELADDDKITPAISTTISDSAEIKITRVAITHISKKQPVDFKIVKKEDKNLDKGKTRIDQAGVKGEKTLTYEIRREDGVEVSRKLTKTETTTAPIDQILIIGTKPVITGWCKFNDLVLDASIKNGLDPDRLCALMHKESNGHPDSSGQGGAHLGLFQYDPGFWADASKKAGYAGADIFDAKSQIYVTAWALTHGYSGRW